MHITLQFLGDTPEDRVVDVIDAMSAGTEAARSSRPCPESIASNRATTHTDPRVASPIALTIGGFGAFPSAQNPRVVWAGVQDETGGIGALWRSVGRQLRNRGFTVDRRPFRPHLTLGYIRRGANSAAIRRISEAIRTAAGAESVNDATSVPGSVGFLATEILLVRSVLSQSGAVYSEVHSISLMSASERTSPGESARE
jgi:RNA 2',3'-cyclic 3'-phosphodiesterase